MSAEDKNLEALSKINNTFAAKGEHLPTVTLSDGTKVPTGTIGALFRNIKLYDRVCAGEDVEGMTKESLEDMMAIAIPTLSKAQFFDVFPVDEWKSTKSQGRNFVGLKAKEMGY